MNDARTLFLLWIVAIFTVSASLEAQQRNISPLELASSHNQKPLSGVGFDDVLSEPKALPDTLSTVRSGRWGHRINVRLIVTRQELEPTPGNYDFSSLSERLAVYQTLEAVDVYLDIRALTPSLDNVNGWIEFLNELLARTSTATRGYIIGSAAQKTAHAQPNELAFFIKTTAVTITSSDQDASIILGTESFLTRSWLKHLYEEDVGPYLDGIAIRPEVASEDILTMIAAEDPDGAIVIFGVPLGDSNLRAPERFVNFHLGRLGTQVIGVTYEGSSDVIKAVLKSVDHIRDLIDQPLVLLDSASRHLTLMRTNSAEDTSDFVGHRLIYGLNSASTYLVYYSNGHPIELHIDEPSGLAPEIRDPVRQIILEPTAFSFSEDTLREALQLPGAKWPLIAEWSRGNGLNLASQTEVISSIVPSLSEIIARHQQAQSAQEVLITTHTADATMEQHFRPNIADPGFDVVTENRFFVHQGNVEFEERSFTLNGTRWGSDRPPFPLLQAEKVLSLPLDLRLTADYRYQFDGIEHVNNRECFVVRFDPIGEDQALYKGTVWIDTHTYLKVKIHSVQSRLGVPVLSNEETQTFGFVGSVDGQDIYLLTELSGQQNILIAGRSLMVERRISFRNFNLNPPGFEAHRQAARDSDNIMFRDTDRGLRYLIKRNGIRIVDDQTTNSAQAMLLGVNVDPSYDFPLPLGGINYLDFNFLGPDSQLAVLFGGVLALVNVQRPKLIGDRLDGSIDLFAIAVPGNDRVYDLEGENEGERILNIPFSTGANIGWRASERIRLTASYQFQYDKYFRDASTSEDFQLPLSTTTNGFGFGLEWRRAGYAFAANWSLHKRSRWQSWGNEQPHTTYSVNHKRYQRHSLSLTKDLFWGKHSIHLNAAYYGGRNLDRFSQYQFGFFTAHRVHGVPSAGVRFSGLGMFRASYSLNLFEQYRLEFAFDHAGGQDNRFASNWQQIIGTGVGFVLRGPKRTLIRGDIGKSFLPDRYRSTGSLVFQIQVLKPL